MNIQTSTDPISFREGHPAFVHVEGDGENTLTVYFESEENRQAYRDIPVEPSSIDLDNDTDEWVDEG